jgi:hypothetical protein
MNTRFLLLTLLTTAGLAGPILANAEEMKTAVNPTDVNAILHVTC